MDSISSVAKERVDLAKALIRAVDKPKAKAKAEANAAAKAGESKTGDGEATA